MKLGLGFAVSAFAAVMAMGERDAAACGGCFHPPTQTASDITDERMLLAASQTQTTLYDQIRYSGSPSSFAWVLPIHGTVDVGLSADVLFDSIDTITATQIQAPPYPACPGPPSYCENDKNGAVSEDAGISSPGAGGGVTVTKQQNVGPYETVQLHATDSSALNAWLTTNGFSIPADVTPVIDEYVKEGFDFLAMKLLPDEGVQAMRPVRVTTQGASLSLPLRMAAIGTGATVGITIWVVADGRYEPQNFPMFHIEDSELIWDWNTQSSNYTTLRAQKEANLVGKGWEIESSLGLNETLISGVIESGGIYYGGGGFGGGGGVAPAANASDDYLPVGDADGGTDSDGGVAGESADQVRADDIAALFVGMAGPTVRVTRMRSDISHAAMTTDFTLQAAADQSELSNTRFVTNSINASCPIYSGCDVVGYGSPDQANAAAANNTGGSIGGCAAAARAEGDGGLSALLGIIGLVFVRKMSDRKKRKSS
jgi:Uncharacterized protein conserved in bacteria (DUF2330)